MSLDERLDDLDLLRNWRSGDPRAGDRLLARHFGAVYRFFRSKAEPAAEALAQATFVACRDGTSTDAKPAFKAVLFASARERLIEHLGRVGERTIDPASTSLARLGLASAAESSDVHAPLRSLPLDVQIAVELHHWERLSVADVAHVIGLGAGAVKGRLARVRKQLDARVLRGPQLLLDAESQRAWTAVRARMFDAPTKGGFGRYRIVEPIELGIVGRTFIAHDEELGRDVALTLIGVEQVAAAERIVGEARARIGIVDPHRSAVLETGITQDPRAFVLVGPWATTPGGATSSPGRIVFVVSELDRGAVKGGAGDPARHWPPLDARVEASARTSPANDQAAAPRTTVLSNLPSAVAE